MIRPWGGAFYLKGKAYFIKLPAEDIERIYYQVYGKLSQILKKANENIAGLQLADFVAYNIIRLEGCKVEQQITDFMKQIHRISYNGGHPISKRDQRSFWGMRVLPSYLRMEELISSNKSLKNAYANLKKERNKLKRTIEIKEESIKQLEEQVETLKSENKNLRNLIKSVDTDSDN